MRSRDMSLSRRLDVVSQALAVARAAERTVVPLPEPVERYLAASDDAYRSRCFELASDAVDQLSVRGAQKPPSGAIMLPARPIFDAVHDLVRCWRDERPDEPLPIVRVQHRILTTGWHVLSYAVALQRYVDQGQTGAHERTAADCARTLALMFDAGNTDRLIGDLWGDADVWVLAWRACGRKDPETLARLGFGAAELALFAADEQDGDG
jgi:hypothetical protein